MKKYLLIFMLTLLSIQIVQAQEVTPSPDDALFTFTVPENGFLIDFSMIGWIPNSQSFVFQTGIDAASYLPQLAQYSLKANLFQSRVPRLGQIELSEEQQQVFIPSSSLAQVSPNDRYVLYVSTEQLCGDEGACYPLLGLGDLETDRHMLLHAPMSMNAVRWSADSSALLVLSYSSYGGVGGMSYVDVAQALAADTYQPRQLINFGIGEPAFVDISRDGRRVLTRDHGNGTGMGRGIFLWDSRLPDTGEQFAASADGENILKDNLVAGASFIPGDDQHLLVIVREGLARYDLKTKLLEVLNPAINSQWITWAYFSPDTRYVLTYAQLDKGDDWQGQIALYLVES